MRILAFIILFCSVLITPPEARFCWASHNLPEGQNFHLKASFYLPAEFLTKREIKIGDFEIKELGLRLQGTYLLLKQEGIVIKASSGRLNVPQLLHFLYSQKILLSKLPISLAGNLALKEVSIIIKQETYTIQIATLAIDNVGSVGKFAIHNIAVAISPQDVKFSGEKIELGSSVIDRPKLLFSRTKNNLDCFFLAAKLKLSELQKLAEEVLGKSFLLYQKEFLPWLQLSSINIEGFLFLESKRIFLNFADKEKLFEHILLSYRAKNLSIFDQNRQIMQLNFDGDLSCNNGFWEVHLSRMSAQLRDLPFVYKDNKLFFKQFAFVVRDLALSLKKKFQVTFCLPVLKADFNLDIPSLNDSFLLYSSGNKAKIYYNGTDFQGKNLAFNLKNSTGGLLIFEGNLFWPLIYDQEEFHLKIENFNSIKNLKILKLGLEKAVKSDVKIYFQVNTPYLQAVLNKGLLSYSPENILLSGDSLRLLSTCNDESKEKKEQSQQSKKAKSSNTSSQVQNFDFSFLSTMKQVSPIWKLSIKDIQYDNYPNLEDLTVKFDLTKFPAIFTLNTTACYTNIGLVAELNPKGSVIVDGELAGVSLPIDQFLACFVSKAPVYILGALTFRTSFETAGQNAEEILNNFVFNAVCQVKNGKILKISNINKHLRWILDILSLVKMNSSKLKDAISFDSLEGVVEGNLSSILIKRFSLASQVLKMNLDVVGRVRLKPKVLKDLRGTISVMGISKQFTVKDDANEK